MEKCTSKFLREWLGLPPCFTGIGLYSATAKLQLPLRNTTIVYLTIRMHVIGFTERYLLNVDELDSY